MSVEDFQYRSEKLHAHTQRSGWEFIRSRYSGCKGLWNALHLICIDHALSINHRLPHERDFLSFFHCNLSFCKKKRRKRRKKKTQRNQTKQTLRNCSHKLRPVNDHAKYTLLKSIPNKWLIKKANGFSFCVVGFYRVDSKSLVFSCMWMVYARVSNSNK